MCIRDSARLPSKKIWNYLHPPSYRAEKPSKAHKIACAYAQQIYEGKMDNRELARRLREKRKRLARKAAATMKKKRQGIKVASKVIAKEKKVMDCYAIYKTYLQDLLSCTDPMKILAGSRTVERFLKSMSIKDAKIGRLVSSKLGIALRDFYVQAGDRPDLSFLKEEVGKTIEELKASVILKIFGADESCLRADSIGESFEECLKVLSDSESDCTKDKRSHLKRNPQFVEHSESGESEKSDDEYTKTAPLKSFAKDTHLMIEACDELTQLLNRVSVGRVTVVCADGKGEGADGGNPPGTRSEVLRRADGREVSSDAQQNH
eukprot:TRINITY_DN9895_c0_g2_i2.p1 TRINITY_DN9895_c0_g2~~TRINITY_DN9895_c0_g2_i2.p1  ORF type:complete len:320 (+),score=61.90 TRINITY_DN9895_c0_g2_i2:73-1032(+)